MNEVELADPSLANNLQQYFFEKERSEIKRIAALVRFFELDKCLSRNLSLYFDDLQVPENCNHCSVCRGQIAKLEYSEPNVIANDDVLKSYLSEFITHMKINSKAPTKTQTTQPLSIGILSRFLTGLMGPLFSRNKVKQLSGFASCENIRFQEVQKKVEQLKIN